MADPIDITIFVERNGDRLAAVQERNWESLDVIFSRISNIEDRKRLLPQRQSPIWDEETLIALLITDRHFLKFVAICNIGEEPSQTRGVLGLGIELTGENIVKSDPSVLQRITERAVYRTPPQKPRQKILEDAIDYFLYRNDDTKAYLVTVRKLFIRELEENNVDLVLLELFYVVFRNTRDIGRQRRQHNIDGCRAIQWFQWSKYKLSEFLLKCINNPDEMLGFITGNNKFVTEVSLKGEIVKILTIEKMDPAREDALNPLTMITQFLPKNTNTRDEDNEDELSIVVSEPELEEEEESDVENDEDQLIDENNKSVDGVEGPPLRDVARDRPLPNNVEFDGNDLSDNESELGLTVGSENGSNVDDVEDQGDVDARNRPPPNNVEFDENDLSDNESELGSNVGSENGSNVPGPGVVPGADADADVGPGGVGVVARAVVVYVARAAAGYVKDYVALTFVGKLFVVVAGDVADAVAAAVDGDVADTVAYYADAVSGAVAGAGAGAVVCAVVCAVAVAVAVAGNYLRNDTENSNS